MPLRAFPSWFLRIKCARAGVGSTWPRLHATLAGHGDRIIGKIIERMRHDGCGGRPGKVELLTGIEGASSRPVRRIVMPWVYFGLPGWVTDQGAMAALSGGAAWGAK